MLSVKVRIGEKGKRRKNEREKERKSKKRSVRKLGILTALQ